MSSPSSYGNQRKVLANVLESDFLGNHLESLLIRQPDSRGQPPPSMVEHPLGPPFVSQRRTPTKERSFRETPSSPPTRVISHMSPGDGIFGTCMPTNAASGSGPSTIQQGRIGSNGYDYFDRSAPTNAGPSGSNQSHNPSSASISTNFGRRPSIRKQQSTLHNRSGSQDHTDAMSDASSAHVSSRGSVSLESHLDRRPSDGTTGTGVTSPMARSESAWSQGREIRVEAKTAAAATTAAAEADSEAGIAEAGESEAEESEPAPTTPCSPSQWEEVGDQTTWERFKRGGVIEPPEADPIAPMSAPWLKDEVLSSRFSSLSTNRQGSASPGRDTVKAEAMDTRNTSGASVTLVPYGNDGRTFRFTNRNEQLAVSRMKEEKRKAELSKAESEKA